ncbi:hypothetical protein OQX61_14030 [Pedobacter sp. PLR]|uniref:hypothetical protein n=1 Tax=Pedobacter sp. PLR TaxID=2994465 RepID=UPI002247D004|nr:hypothetical protein [Pedobacter sp. PLR]MCX2452389.1 hypothetical protein [Pedobacter sp. PLR]
MEFIGILFALFFAIMLTAVFSLAFRNTGPWGGFWTFFILLFFISLAAGEWAAQRGPSAWGYYWAPGFIAAIVVALLLAATSPDSAAERARKRAKELRNRPEGAREAEVSVAATVLGIFFWILIVVLALIALAGVVSKM